MQHWTGNFRSHVFTATACGLVVGAIAVADYDSHRAAVAGYDWGRTVTDFDWGRTVASFEWGRAVAGFEWGKAAAGFDWGRAVVNYDWT